MSSTAVMEKPTLCFFVQYYKNEVNLTAIMNQIKKDFTEHSDEDLKDLDIYVKAEDNMAYYVANHHYESKVNLWNISDTYSDLHEEELDFHKNIIFQFRGKEINANEIIQNIIHTIHSSAQQVQIQDLEIYAKIEDETAYYLVNHRISKKLPLC